MPADNKDFRTPGQLIQHLLAEKEWTQGTLGVVVGLSEAQVSRLVRNLRRIDAPLALALSEVFDMPADKFLDLQQQYDLAKARIEARPDPQRATRAHLFGS